MPQVSAITLSLPLQALFSTDLKNSDGVIVSKLIEEQVNNLENILRNDLHSQIAQLTAPKPDLVALEIAKSLLTYSARQKKDKLKAALTTSFETIVALDNPRWISVRNTMIRSDDTPAQRYVYIRERFLGQENWLVGAEVTGEIFKYDMKAARRMYYFAKAMNNNEIYSSSHIRPGDHILRNPDRVTEFYQIKQEELKVEYEILTGCRANVQSLAGAVLPSWEKAFDDRIAQVKSDIAEVDQAFKCKF